MFVKIITYVFLARNDDRHADASHFFASAQGLVA